MPNKAFLLLGASCLALLLSTGQALADPGNGKSGQGKEQAGKGASSQQKPAKQEKASKAAHAGRGDVDDDDDDFQRRYDDDLDDIRRIFTRYSGSYGQAQALPPGIRKNLARGKPLPPGIAKKLDPGFARQLPNYQGYEWQQVGSDAALVNVTTGIVREILSDVLR